MVNKASITLSADQMAALIKEIEKDFPGYWYSISQKVKSVTLSLGPSKYSLLDTDRAWSTTREGDTGIIREIPISDDYDPSMVMTVLKGVITQEISEARNNVLNIEGISIPPYTPGRRIHDREDRHAFRKAYSKFLRDLDSMSSHNTVIDELYVGSCQLSADVSIRGTQNGKSVSIDKDLTGTKKLADSLAAAHTRFLVIHREKVS